VDAVCYEMNFGLGFGNTPEAIQGRMDLLQELQSTLSKPVFAVVTAGHREERGIEIRKALADRDIVAYPNFQRAAAAYRKLLDYYTAFQEAEVGVTGP
jgi:hypothetical protein